MMLILALAAAVPGTAFRDRGDAPVMIVVPAGRALLGSDEAETAREGRAPAAAAAERPRREVRFDRPFAIGKHHVTRRQFAVFARATRRRMAGCVVAIAGAWSDGASADHDYRRVGFAQRDDEPALCVDWADATAYAAWLSARTGARYRLPSEGEWEYAARAGTQTARWWGDDTASICAHANGGDRAYAVVMPADTTANTGCSDGYAHTNPVGRFAPNPFGLHDMLGNAWQWVADCFTPAVEGGCAARAIRGGSWHNGTAVLRSATRFGLPPTLRSASLGFRVVRELP
jgi:formylglycine-generating enzyme required for sulfatase activity